MCEIWNLINFWKWLSHVAAMREKCNKLAKETGWLGGGRGEKVVTKIAFYPEMLTRCLTGGELIWVLLDFRFNHLDLPLPRITHIWTSHGKLRHCGDFAVHRRDTVSLEGAIVPPANVIDFCTCWWKIVPLCIFACRCDSLRSFFSRRNFVCFSFHSVIVTSV